VNLNRGDILLAIIPHSSGTAPKTRPLLVVQANYYNQRISNLLVASITSNLTRKDDDAHCLIDVTTSEGQQSGLRKTSLVSCLNLAVIRQADVSRIIGKLPDAMMSLVDDCLKVAMGL